MDIKTLSLGPIGTNCYIISKNDECLIIDPGGDAHLVSNYVTENNLTPVAILLTHAHYDHIGAVDELRNKFELDVYLHENEKDWLENPQLNRSGLSLGAQDAIVTRNPDHLVQPGPLSIGSFKMIVAHTPGHSPGSVTYIFEDDGFIVSGDVLFYQGIGRTDLPEGSIEQLAHSIVDTLYELPDDFEVYPGHGPSTVIGEEKVTNPFTLQFYRP